MIELGCGGEIIRELNSMLVMTGVSEVAKEVVVETPVANVSCSASSCALDSVGLRWEGAAKNSEWRALHNEQYGETGGTA